ncbi:MAG: 50S ribosomal protein L24 [Patescibacteria group bacterium]
MNRSITKIKLRVGDNVMVLTGREKGKTGKVTAVHPMENKVTIEGINIVRRHTKPNQSHPQGGIIDTTKPIDVSKVGIIDPATKKPTRVAYEVSKDGSKTRVYASSRKEIK